MKIRKEAIDAALARAQRANSVHVVHFSASGAISKNTRNSIAPAAMPNPAGSNATNADLAIGNCQRVARMYQRNPGQEQSTAGPRWAAV